MAPATPSSTPAVAEPTPLPVIAETTPPPAADKPTSPPAETEPAPPPSSSGVAEKNRPVTVSKVSSLSHDEVVPNDLGKYVLRKLVDTTPSSTPAVAEPTPLPVIAETTPPPAADKPTSPPAETEPAPPPSSSGVAEKNRPVTVSKVSSLSHDEVVPNDLGKYVLRKLVDS
ncbi:uncharacterized protein LOC126092747 [Schistocerca cancellata]|uniref:uncharacterized protein LOC126092747 n=1 Tax=Schistocerca cancellata TaxID=274614 RepID=UPI0021180624|nr:uncharacterized protein LOC126092747 [Schistocerca cancellata]